jgi:hypothetical protein
MNEYNSASNNLYSLTPSTSYSHLNEPVFSIKNTLIVVLIVLLIFSFLGINLLQIFANIVQYTTNVLKPFLQYLLSLIGYSTGTVINTSADILTSTGKTGLDIADGTFHSVGNLLINPSEKNIGELKKDIDTTLNVSPIKINNPSMDTTASPIQNSNSASKSSWCLVGDYLGKRGCIEIGDHDKCLSNQVFPNQEMCLKSK